MIWHQQKQSNNSSIIFIAEAFPPPALCEWGQETMHQPAGNGRAKWLPLQENNSAFINRDFI